MYINEFFKHVIRDSSNKSMIRFSVMMTSLTVLCVTIGFVRSGIPTVELLAFAVCATVVIIACAVNTIHTNIFTLTAVALTLFLVRDHYNPTEGWGTIFYTESEIEFHKEIRSLEESVSKIRAVYNK